MNVEFCLFQPYNNDKLFHKRKNKKVFYDCYNYSIKYNASDYIPKSYYILHGFFNPIKFIDIIKNLLRKEMNLYKKLVSMFY